MKPVTLAQILADPEFIADCQRARDNLEREVAARREAERAVVHAWIERDDSEPTPRFFVNYEQHEPKARTSPLPGKPQFVRPFRNPRAKTLTFQGFTLTHAEWSERTGIPLRTLKTRLRKGWSVEATLSKQPDQRRRRGVGSDFADVSGTGGGSVARDISELEFSE